MRDNELIQKIPTLKRYDHTEYIQFRMDPLPKLNSENDVKKIPVHDFVGPKYKKCFESDHLNTIQSIVFDHAFNSN